MKVVKIVNSLKPTMADYAMGDIYFVRKNHLYPDRSVFKWEAVDRDKVWIHERDCIELRSLKYRVKCWIKFICGFTLYEKLQQGVMIPRFYAPVYYDYATCRMMAAPIGLHLIVLVVRRIWFTFIGAWRLVPSDPREAYLQGVKHGKKLKPESGIDEGR